MSWFGFVMYRVILALGLLGGPWLILTGSLVMAQITTGTAPTRDPVMLAIGMCVGLVCVLWAIHALKVGPEIVSRWWLLLCALIYAYIGGTALRSSSDPYYLQYVMVPLSLGWAFTLFYLHLKRIERVVT